MLIKIKKINISNSQFSKKIKVVFFKFIIFVFVFVFSFQSNVNTVSATPVVEVGSSLFQQITTAGANIATKLSTGLSAIATKVTAVNTLSDWTKKLADFAIKKMAKKMAIDAVNRMSACIDGSGPCKKPLYLTDPKAFVNNIASSEIQRLSDTITSDINNITSQIVNQATNALMQEGLSIEKRIANSMKVLDKYNSDRIALICSQNYLDRVKVVEGVNRYNEIVGICNNAKSAGNVSPENIKKIDYVIGTSKTPINSAGVYLAVFSDPSKYKAENIAAGIENKVAEDIAKRQQDAKDAVNGCGGYMPSTSPQKSVRDKNGNELNISETINTPCGTMQDQDSFARLQQVRSWENVNSIEDFFSVATDQLSSSLINRAKREVNKAVSEVVVDAKTQIKDAVNGITEDIRDATNNSVGNNSNTNNSSYNDLPTDLKCSTNDIECKNRQDIIRGIVDDSNTNSKVNVEKNLEQSIELNNSNFKMFRKAIETKTYHKNKIDKVTNLALDGIKTLENAIAYSESQEFKKLLEDIASSRFDFPYNGNRVVSVINNGVSAKVAEMKNKIPELQAKTNNYTAKSNQLNSDISNIRRAEAELLNLAGDKEIYPSLYNLSIYNQCLDKVKSGNIKSILDLKSNIIKRNGTNYITDNLAEYKDTAIKIEYACDVSSPKDSRYDALNAIVIKEAMDYHNKYTYEQFKINSPDSPFETDEESKIFYYLNLEAQNIQKDELINFAAMGFERYALEIERQYKSK